MIAKIVPNSGAHNTVYGLDGKHAYLAGLKSPLLTVADTSSHTAAGTVGPFGAPVRPFTVNGAQTLCFVNVNGLLGFEVGDLTTGKTLHRVEVQGYKQGPIKRHGCPSHGIGLTPDEKELWVADAANMQRARLRRDRDAAPAGRQHPAPRRAGLGHVQPRRPLRLPLHRRGDRHRHPARSSPPSPDEQGRAVQSEKLLEIDFEGDQPVRAGDQFGLGRVR